MQVSAAMPQPKPKTQSVATVTFHDDPYDAGRSKTYDLHIRDVQDSYWKQNTFDEFSDAWWAGIRRGGFTGSMHGVFQAQDGTYYLRQLDGWSHEEQRIVRDPGYHDPKMCVKVTSPDLRGILSTDEDWSVHLLDDKRTVPSGS